ERVSVEHGYVPERDSERDSGPDNTGLEQIDPTESRAMPLAPVARHSPKSERQRGHRESAHDRKRQPQRAVHAEGDRQGEEQRGERPGKHRRKTAQAEGARDQRARNQKAGGRRPESQAKADP